MTKNTGNDNGKTPTDTAAPAAADTSPRTKAAKTFHAITGALGLKALASAFTAQRQNAAMVTAIHALGARMGIDAGKLLRKMPPAAAEAFLKAHEALLQAIEAATALTSSNKPAASKRPAHGPQTAAHLTPTIDV